MKYTLAIAILLASSVSGIKLKEEPWSEEGWIDIPKFDLKVSDPHPKWGHEV